MEKLIHRKAKFRYGLCGAQTNVENSTLQDDEVTCEKCKEILSEVTQSKESSMSRAERRSQEFGEF